VGTSPWREAQQQEIRGSGDSLGTNAHTTARRLLAIVAVLGLSLAACSSDSSSDDASPEQSGSAGTEVSTGIDREGVVRVGYDIVQATSETGFSLDPAVSFNQNDAISYLIFGRLMRPMPDGTLEPDLAQSAEVVDSGTIKVVLRPGLTWQDGTPFDANSVKAGLDRMLTEAKPEFIGQDFPDLTAVTVVDPTTVQLTIKDGSAAGWYDTFMGSRAVTIVKPGTDFSKPIGAGPMKVTQYRVGQNLELERWDGYYNAESVNFAGMDIVHISSESPQASVSALQAGQIDFGFSAVSLTPSVTGDLETLAIADPARMNYVMICKTNGPLADARVRTALNKAVDRDALNDALFDGTAEPSTELWPEGHRFYSEEYGDALAYDQDAAKKLLADAGYANGGISVDLTTLNGQDLPAMAEVLQQQWAAIGVTTTINVSSNFVEDYLAADAPGLGLIPGGDSGRKKIDGWTGDSLGNICDYSDPEIDKLFADLATVSESSDEAKQMWDRVNEISTDDALSVFLTFGSRISAYNKENLHVEEFWPIGGALLIPDIYSSYMIQGS
jgi:ABC-type transport system substrate-binding protein